MQLLAMVRDLYAVERDAKAFTDDARLVLRVLFDALAAGHSRALAKLSGDIAAAIRAEADKKP